MKIKRATSRQWIKRDQPRDEYLESAVMTYEVSKFGAELTLSDGAESFTLYIGSLGNKKHREEALDTISRVQGFLQEFWMKVNDQELWPAILEDDEDD